LEDEISEDSFDVITDQTPLALRALTAYKCEHLSEALLQQRCFAQPSKIILSCMEYF
jgi:hypothetical protein